MPERTFIAISGGFDPLHVGHLDYIHAASEYGPVAVILNSDAWLIRKKGYRFMPYADRKGILMALKRVDAVWRASDDDGTVCKTIMEYKDRIVMFGNGGDRVAENTPEVSLCRELGIKLTFGLGIGKIRSSSHLVREAHRHDVKRLDGFIGEQC